MVIMLEMHQKCLMIMIVVVMVVVVVVTVVVVVMVVAIVHAKPTKWRDSITKVSFWKFVRFSARKLNKKLSYR